MGSWENRYEREVGGGVLKKYSAQYFAIEKKKRKEKRAEGRSTRYTVACQGGRKFGPSLPSPPPPSHMLLLLQRYHFLLTRVIVIIIITIPVNLCLTSDGHLHL